MRQKCAQPKQRDPAARKRANEASIAAPWALIGYFLDHVLFEMLARTARLPLPAEPFHVPRWREATTHNFTVYVHHVMRVGHLASPMVWRSLLYPSPARLPRSSHFPSLMTFRHLPWLHPPSGLCGPCSLFMLRALVLLSRTHRASPCAVSATASTVGQSSGPC